MPDPLWVRQAYRTLAYLNTLRNRTWGQEEQRAFLLDALHRAGYAVA